MKALFIFILFIPIYFVAQDKKTKTTSERLEIVGKWNSYSSMDSTKNEVVEFLPDGNFVEYKGDEPKHSDTKYVFYKDELSMKTGELTMKFKVHKESYGLFLKVMHVNNKPSDKLIWVKLFPFKKEK